MNKNSLIRTTGWITLGALIGFSPVLFMSSDAESQTTSSNAAVPAAVSTPSIKSPAEHTQEPGPLVAVRELASNEKASPKASPTPQGAEPLTEVAAREEGVPFVERLVVASAIENREPTPLETGTLGESVTAFVELKNSTEEDSGVVITFEHESGKRVGFIELTVPKESPRFRTWGRTRNIDEPGEWHAIVSTKTGQELSRSSFTVRS